MGLDLATPYTKGTIASGHTTQADYAMHLACLVDPTPDDALQQLFIGSLQAMHDNLCTYTASCSSCQALHVVAAAYRHVQV